MSVLVRVEDEPPATRLDYLRDVVSESIAPYGVRVDANRDLRAQILTGQLGTVEITRVSGPPIEAFRTSRQIRVSDPELFKIDVQVRGHTVFAQGDREASLAPGDLTLMDLSRPNQLADRGDAHEIVAVKFPHSALPLPYDDLTRVTAVRISGHDGLGAPISSIARHMAQHLEDDHSTEGARLASALMDLLTVALAARLNRGATTAPATLRSALLTSVQAFIEQRLADPDLSPGAIAAANNVSLRALHKLFEEQQATVASWIRERRLERCRRDLLDPNLGQLPVSAIASRWGLPDPAHFSRVFRAAYGLPPSEYRRTADPANFREVRERRH